ncbi:MAG: hypothetical protein AUI16_21485 [Alphaproteobacteria bacterium 13_2_20CM_2_64_7]|nr:MAG: hypothetical protein AUI16_21485 [Alphaproteobacteria bacterium 13_2_20CM_2_64_7]
MVYGCWIRCGQTIAKHWLQLPGERSKRSVRHHITTVRFLIWCGLDCACLPFEEGNQSVAPDYRRQVERALARQIEADASRQTRQIEIDRKALDRAAQATSAGDLTVADLAETIADALKNERREILKHVNRMFQHAAMKTAHYDLRIRNLHKRLFQLESEMRRLTRSRSP